MAWIYSLSIECGGAAGDPQALLHHFRDFKVPLSDGRQVAVELQSPEPNWLLVIPETLSRSGVQSASDARDMSLAGEALLEHLKTARGYRYALPGVDTDRFVEFEEMDQLYCQEGYSGLVIFDDLWHKLGEPRAYRPFAKGYHWQPYRGESFQPPPL